MHFDHQSDADTLRLEHPIDHTRVCIKVTALHSRQFMLEMWEMGYPPHHIGVHDYAPTLRFIADQLRRQQVAGLSDDQLIQANVYDLSLSISLEAAHMLDELTDEGQEVLRQP